MRIYKLFWDEFSGWYLELVKPAYQTPIDRATMDATRRFFDYLMRLIHPFMPFVTEEIWQDLEPRKAGESIMYAPMPKATAVDENLLMRFDLVKEIISNVRNIRKQRNIPQRKTLTLNFILDENFPAELADVVVKMCNLENVAAVEKKNPAAESFMVKTTQYFIPMEDSIDVEAELKKLSDELTYFEGFLASVMKKLSNERFVQSAPEKVVANERAKQADAEAKIAAIKERMEALK